MKELRRIYPVFKWMNEHRDKWSFIERELLDSRVVAAHHHQGHHRGDYGSRDVVDHHLPLEHNSHADSDMAGMNDSEEDDDESNFDAVDSFGHHTTNNEGPYQIVIEGAGTRAVNGVYSQDGYFENACKYCKDGRWKESEQKFYIFQCNVSNNTKHWYISIVPFGGNPGTSSDIDFYSAPAGHECLRVPPDKGWVKAPEGTDPAPRLEFRNRHDHNMQLHQQQSQIQQPQQRLQLQHHENEENVSWAEDPDENQRGPESGPGFI